MFNRLNGWQRIGVVLSVLWLTWIALVAVNSYYAERGAFIHLIEGKNGYCRKYEPVTPSGRTPPTAEEYFGVGKCLPENYVESTPDRAVLVWQQVLVAAVVPVVVGWLGIYLLMLVMRWVAKGFRRGET